MKYFTLALALLAVATADAATTWTLQSKEYQVDTLYHANVGPGTTQTSLKLSGGSNLKVFYTVTDLTHPNVEMRVVMAGDKYSACNTVSSMAIGKTTPTEQYFAGVNADFFGNSAPIGSTVVNQEIYNLANNGWTSWAVVNGKTPVANEMTFAGTVTSPSASHPLSGVNTDRYTNYLVIYTNRKSNNTGTNIYGYEVALKPAEGKPGVMFGKSVYTVTTAPSSAGSMAIPAGQVVLSGNGTADIFVKSLKVGDEITVDLSLVNGEKQYSDVRQMAGGKPMIVSGGQVLDTQGALDHLTSLNPRTAIGYDATGTKLVMLVVDGRSSASVGVISRQLADMMIQLGCTEAMNFDGGGSSALYIKELGVRNNPSDGRERAVTNGVYAVAVAPADKEVAALEFEQKSIALPRYCYYTPRVYAYNKYGVLIDADYKDYSLNCPSDLGSITSDGKVLFTNGSGYHALTATANGVTASVPVMVSTANPRLRFDNVLVDPYKPYTIEIVALVEGKDIPVDNSALIWSSDDENVAAVDENGTVSGVSQGETVIRGKVDDITLELAVKVEVPQSRYLKVYPVGTAYTTAKSGTKDIAVTEDESGCLSVDFTISNTRSPYLEVQASSLSFAIPDSLRLEINPGSANITSIYVGYINESGRKATKSYNVELPNDKSSAVLIPVSDLTGTADRSRFPLSLTGLRFYFSNANASTHHMTIPAYDFVYDNIKDEGGIEAPVDDAAASALHFSENPVAPGQYVEINADGTIKIYNIAGELVGESDSHGFTAPANRGIYLVTTGTQTGKLIVR
ncbi:MAG: phosphodiester glycosidase family protein [Muribaculaceae bacterium]|nr:phosphodiester glycosidase family protein [Muribaculaceae bacterium]